MSEIKRIIQLAVPIFLGQLGFTLFGFIDNIMVGSLGVKPLAAISLANSVVFVCLAVGVGFSYMITPIVSKAFGANQFNEINQIFYSSIVACFCVGSILSVLLWVFKFIIENGNEFDPLTVSLAIDYLLIMIFSLIPTMLFQSLKQFTDGISLTKYGMIVIVSSNILNIFLNYILIFGKFGFTAYGVEGAALGTLISRIIMLLLMLSFCCFDKKINQYLKRPAITYISLDQFSKLSGSGFFSSIQILFKIALFSSTIFLTGLISSENQAANQILLNISSIAFALPLALGSASSIRVSKLIGLENRHLIKKVLQSVMLVFLISELFLILFLNVFDNQIPYVYIDDKHTIELFLSVFFYISFFIAIDGIEVIFLGFLKGFNDTKLPAVFCFMSYWLIGFPTAYILNNTYGIRGIWLGICIGVFFSASTLILRFLYLSVARPAGKNLSQLFFLSK